MPLFGRRKTEEFKAEIKEVGGLAEDIVVETEEPHRPVFAPLFVKIDRYKTVLDLMSEIKTTMQTIRNTIFVLNELDKLRNESMDMIRKSVEGMDKRILSLDTEFIRPSEIKEKAPPEATYIPGNLEDVLGSLKSQLEQLKTDLKTTA